MPSCLDVFQAAYSASDLEKMEALAHRLRGDALCCGISALEIAALRLEVACRNRAPDIADKLSLPRSGGGKPADFEIMRIHSGSLM